MVGLITPEESEGARHDLSASVWEAEGERFAKMLDVPPV
jgi:hypothetical protein